jgi:FKBP-type peptidyl-prolyl cis-trans isomerase FklB
MSEGAKWEVVIPPELGYGSAGAGGLIGPNQTLVFEIELIEVK